MIPLPRKIWLGVLVALAIGALWWLIPSEEERIQQVLMNLIINSLKYGTPKMLNNNVCTLNGDTFDMVHQFNRVPEWHEIIKEKYNIV